MLHIKPSLPSLIDIEDFIDEESDKNYPDLRIAILRNVTMEPMEPYLKYLSLMMGFNPTIVFGDFDNIAEETMGDSSVILDFELDAVLVFTPLPALSSLLDVKFSSLSQKEIGNEVSFILDSVYSIVNSIRKKTNAMILWHGIETPIYPSLGIRDTQLQWGQTALVSKINNKLSEMLCDVGNAYLVNMEACLGRLGANQFYDIRYWNIAKSPYSRQGLAEIANEDFRYIRAQKGFTCKCLVLDCDNTLWGGIIGEDGLNGIKLGQDYPGNSFVDFQNEILSLYRRGVIIALCSKNNEEDVWEVFDKHPDMLLRREHISAWRINWEDKVTNLQDIARELNIDVDSIAFADDSDFEINFVQHQLPEVKLIHLPVNFPAKYRWNLAASGYFDFPFITKEDLDRGKLYKEENQRREMRESSTDLDSYCRSLKINIEIDYATDLTIPRVAQQTKKTNQFNLTTRRYSDLDISGFSQSPEHDVLSLRVSDKFGDMGVVGSCIIVYKENTAIIDTLLLSCRALGRGVEKVFLNVVMNVARSKGVSHVLGQYIPTKKNNQVIDFYLNQNFISIPNYSEEVSWYQFDLNNQVQHVLDGFESVQTPLAE